MNHVKKLVLVPHETVARLHDTPTSSPQTQMNSLDTEMNYILRQQYADDSEKWKKYNETLQRYLHFAKEGRKPFSIEIGTTVEDKKSTTTMPTSQTREQLAALLPKTYKEQALKIHDYLSTEGSPITWDSSGLVSISGTSLPQSNIIDLIADLTRSRKNFEPQGMSAFIKTLASLNIPLELVRNDKHRTAILQAKQSGAGITPLTHTPSTKTQHTSKTRKQNTKKPLVVPKKNAWKTW